jgi:hypothetical protein
MIKSSFLLLGNFPIILSNLLYHGNNIFTIEKQNLLSKKTGYAIISKGAAKKRQAAFAPLSFIPPSVAK